MYERRIAFDKHISGDVEVYDWFDVKSGSKISLEEIQDTESSLVNKIIFYDSCRKGNGGKGRKDLVSVSLVDQNEILEYDNSENNVRLKTIQMMKKQGLRGRPNGYNNMGKQLFYAIDIDHTHREIIKKYEPKHTLSEIIKLARKEKDIWNLTKKLLRRKQISILRESSRLQVDVSI